MNWARIRLLFTGWLAIAVLPVHPVSAAPLITVGNGCAYPTIAAGIAAVGPGGTVHIEGGRTFEEHLVILKDLTLRGGYTGCATGSSEPTVIDGNRAGRILYIDGGLQVQLENLSLLRGKTDFSGGGVFFAASEGGSLTLDNVTLSECSADIGGAVWIGPDAELVGNGVEFDDNHATLGGAIRLYGGRASLSNSSFFDNHADDGGAVAANAASGFAPRLSLADGTALLDNHAYLHVLEGLGGAVYFVDGVVDVAWDTLFLSNRATQGGAVYLVNSLLRGGGQYYGNLAELDGGALFAIGSTVEVLDGPLFADNEATTGLGGAVYGSDSSVMRVRDGAISGNAAGDGGGGFWVGWESSLEITRTSAVCHWSGCHQLTNNTSLEGGGGAISAYGAKVHIEGQLVANNSATHGGALSADQSHVTSTGCVFAANDETGVEFGDAVYLGWGSSFTSTGVTFAFNDEGGGASGVAISVNTGSSLTLEAAIIWGHGLSIDGPDQAVTCSNVEGGYTGAGNTSVDPQFVSPISLDYHLEPTSPLIDRCTVPGGRSGDWDWEVRPWVINNPVTPFDMGADEVGSIPLIGIFVDGFESGDISGWTGAS